MVYLSDKGSGSGDMRMRRCTSESDSQLKRVCVDCGTSKTPLWRSGPAGPKSLCNACGIKSRKKRMPIESISKENKKPKNETTTNECNSSEKDKCKSSDKISEKDECKSSDKSSEKDECKSSDKSSEKDECKSSDEDEETDTNEIENMVKRIKMVLNGEPTNGTSNDEADLSGCDFEEEERAAILLMALSYGIIST